MATVHVEPRVADNPYLRGMREGPRIARNVAWLWAAVVLLGLGVWGLGTQRLSVAAIGILGAFVPLGIVIRRRGSRRGALGPAALQREIQAIELARLRGDIAESVARAHAVFGQPLAGATRATLYGALAQCAEQQADVVSASDLYARALREIGWATGKSRFGAFTGPTLVARHAFVLAAEGKLEEATTELARASHADEHPATRYLAVRAEALLLVRRKQFAEALALLDRHRAILRYGANLRDRLLLHAMASYARASLEGTFRGALPELSGADARVRAWVATMMPEASPLVGIDTHAGHPS
jgi:tetratricopeptide (TPR) repeat protein